MKVLVVGGAGYVGSVLVQELLKRGHEVRIFDNFLLGDHGYKKACQGWSGHESDCPIGVIEGDARDIDPAVFKLFMPDVVINLAGFSNDPTAEFRPDLNYELNVTAAAKVAYEARRAGVKRLIYASSCSMYHSAAAEVDAEVTEVFPVKPHWHYATSKYAGELSSMAFNKPGEFEVVSLRKGTVCGPSPRMRYDLMLNTMFRSAMTTGVINLHGGGWVYRPLVGVQDAARAYAMAAEAESEQVTGQVFNVVGDNARVRDYAIQMRDAIHNAGKRVELTESPPPKWVRSYRVSGRKMREVLGWSPAENAFTITKDLLDSLHRGELPAWDDPLAENIKVIEQKCA